MTRRATPPGVFRCLVLLAVADAATRLIGLRRTLALARRLGRGRGSGAAALVDRTAHNVAVAAAFYPRRARCLEQSLILFVLLRRRGERAELKLGVRPLPFYAHAWVEIDGVPVNEPAQLPLNMATFPLLGA
ncbi:MAG TPA: lasso peptide biosynthesis B2 protein [Longimicrobiales bacterium]|nr:lasso peptide biosynthesis B2 protein [Longimicrobiales bacterium]